VHVSRWINGDARGRGIKANDQAVFALGFDGQGASDLQSSGGTAGSGVVGPRASQFTSATITGAAKLSTVPANNTTYSQYDLLVDPPSDGTADVSKQIGSGTDNNGMPYSGAKTLTFTVELNAAWSSTSGSMMLAEIDPSGMGHGTMQLVIQPGGVLSLQYDEPNGTGEQTVPSTGSGPYALNANTPYVITIDRNPAMNVPMNQQFTTLSLAVNGTTVAQHNSSAVLPTWQAVLLGDVSRSQPGSKLGAFHLDDVYVNGYSIAGATTVKPIEPLDFFHSLAPHPGHTRSWLHPKQVVTPITQIQPFATPIKLSISKEGIYRLTSSAINSGQELVNWTGHSTQGTWGSMLAILDVAGLTNVNKPAAVFEWGCQTAYYLDPTSRDISSSLLVDSNASGPTGAAITVGSTGQDLIDQQAVLSGGQRRDGADRRALLLWLFETGEEHWGGVAARSCLKRG